VFINVCDIVFGVPLPQAFFPSMSNHICGDTVRIDRMGKVKIESDLVDISYRRLDKPRKIVIVEFQLKRSISPDEAADIASLIAEFIASFVRPKDLLFSFELCVQWIVAQYLEETIRSRTCYFLLNYA